MNSRANVPKARVVIIGGGFAGLSAARALKDAPAEVIVVDRNNHHLFQPLLYQVATAGLAPNEVAQPIRTILKDQKNAQVLLDEVTDIDAERRVVHLQAHALPFDYIARDLKGRPTLPFRYHDKGRMATIGRALAVARLGDSVYSGFTAWLLWLFVHLVKLVGFRNRTFVLFDWMFAYLRSERSGRVVLGSQRRKRPADARLVSKRHLADA